jgi:hypothetical protein
MATEQHAKTQKQELPFYRRASAETATLGPQDEEVTGLQRAVRDIGRASPNSVLALQRAAGNQAVHRLVGDARPQAASTAPGNAVQRTPHAAVAAPKTGGKASIESPGMSPAVKQRLSGYTIQRNNDTPQGGTAPMTPLSYISNLMGMGSGAANVASNVKPANMMLPFLGAKLAGVSGAVSAGSNLQQGNHEKAMFDVLGGGFGMMGFLPGMAGMVGNVGGMANSATRAGRSGYKGDYSDMGSSLFGGMSSAMFMQSARRGAMSSRQGKMLMAGGALAQGLGTYLGLNTSEDKN